MCGDLLEMNTISIPRSYIMKSIVNIWKPAIAKKKKKLVDKAPDDHRR